MLAQFSELPAGASRLHFGSFRQNGTHCMPESLGAPGLRTPPTRSLFASFAGCRQDNSGQAWGTRASGLNVGLVGCQDRRDLEEAADQRMRAEFVEEAGLFASFADPHFAAFCFSAKAAKRALEKAVCLCALLRRVSLAGQDLLLARRQLQFALEEQETAQAQVATAQAQVATAQAQVATAQEQVATAQEQEAMAVRRLARAEESGDAKKVQAAKKEVQEAERKVEKAKKEVDRAKKEVQEAERKVEKAKKEVEKAKKEVEKAERKVERAKKEVKEAKASGRRSPRWAESVASAGRLCSEPLVVVCGFEIPRAARTWFWWGCPDRIQRTRKSQDSIFADCGGSCRWQARYGAPHERMVAIPCHSGRSVIPAGQH